MVSCTDNFIFGRRSFIAPAYSGPAEDSGTIILTWISDASALIYPFLFVAYIFDFSRDAIEACKAVSVHYSSGDKDSNKGDVPHGLAGVSALPTVLQQDSAPVASSAGGAVEPACSRRGH